MRINLKIILALAAGAGVIAGPPAAANLIINGGFESPAVPENGFTIFNTGASFTGWTVVGSAGSAVGIVDDGFVQDGIAFVSQEGEQWLDLTGLAHNDATGVQQIVATTPGAIYDLSFFVGNVVHTGQFGTSSRVNVFVNGLALLPAINSSGNANMLTWTSHLRSFTATGASTTLAFRNGDPGNDNSNALDNISLVLSSQAVPEPETWALMLVGFGAVGAMLRRGRIPGRRHARAS